MTTTGLSIRRATTDDRAAIERIYREASLSNAGDREVLLANPAFLQWPVDSLASGMTVVATAADGPVVGFAKVQPGEDGVELEDLFVDPAWMRRGVATALLRHLCDVVMSQSGDALTVVANPHALDFYLSVGFVDDGEVATELGTGRRMRLHLRTPTRTDEERAQLRDLVRRGYDVISRSYRSDAGESNVASRETTATYTGWIDELGALLPANAHVLDLGCGAGVPASRALVAHGFNVTGVDISRVQIARAKQLVPEATFLQADMVTWDSPDGSFDAIVSLYALIHVPLEDQRPLFARMRRWLIDSGYLLLIVGSRRWTGVEDYMGADMFWDHEGPTAYDEWLRAAGFEPQWSRFIPEGDAGHILILARAV
ncbi:MAG TPA: GNAT family N-acetyltransferase [Mycobacteriales bacterium]|nr:GNAT family N-acetyltransferase [Mycobacteriales bacterium]